MSLVLLCPTRKRPEQCKRMIDSVNATAGNPVDIAIMFSNEDCEAYKLPCGRYGEKVGIHQYTIADGAPTVFKWNQMAMHQMATYSHSLFMLAADDMIFTTPLWDTALLEHYSALKDKHHVYAFRDSRDVDGTPHPIVTREYMQAMGYFLPPLFLHWYVDTWTVEIAKHNNCFTHLKDYELVHDKPFYRGEPDDTHQNLRRECWLNNDMFTNEKCQHMLALEKNRLKMRMAKVAA